MRKLWTQTENKILQDKYPNCYTAELSKLLNRSESSVYGQAYILGLKKSKEFKAMELERQGDRLRTVGVRHQYPKGHVPQNKGKIMDAELYDKVKHTFFQKGNSPHNTKYDGHERITEDGYVVVRVELDKYVLKHRHVWEKENGPVPKGMVLAFKDKNKQNIVLENLELITMKENMKRNSIVRIPIELRPTKILINKIKKQTKKLCKKIH